ncbi:MAG TPA: DedA family protein [Sporichthyaceae bacterium]|jgi:membrane protein DedA with SNARE-associated domain|nr:DedA family protein [Sporichthyaceae bacterium]
MGGLVDHVLNLDQGWLYLIVGLLVFAEYALFIGFVPGETAAVLGGVQAARGGAHLSAAMAVVVAASVLGACVGFEVGRRFGPRLLNIKFLKGHQHRMAKAMDMLGRRGGTAVFLGRFVAFFRPVMPALAGMSGMGYRKYLTFNALGGIVWGTTFVTVGYLAGNSYQRVEHTAGKAGACVVAAAVVVAVVVLGIRKHRAERAPEPAGAPDSG